MGIENVSLSQLQQKALDAGISQIIVEQATAEELSSLLSGNGTIPPSSKTIDDQLSKGLAGNGNKVPDNFGFEKSTEAPATMVSYTTMGSDVSKIVSREENESWNEFVTDPDNNIIYKSDGGTYLRAADGNTYRVTNTVDIRINRWTNEENAALAPDEVSTYSKIANFDSRTFPGSDKLTNAYAEAGADPGKLSTDLLVLFNQSKAQKDFSVYGDFLYDGSPVLHVGDTVSVPVIEIVNNPPPIPGIKVTEEVTPPVTSNVLPVDEANLNDESEKVPVVESDLPPSSEVLKTLTGDGAKVTFRREGYDYNNFDNIISDIPENCWLAKHAKEKGEEGYFNADTGPFYTTAGLFKEFGGKENSPEYITYRMLYEDHIALLTDQEIAACEEAINTGNTEYLDDYGFAFNLKGENKYTHDENGERVKLVTWMDEHLSTTREFYDEQVPSLIADEPIGNTQHSVGTNSKNVVTGRYSMNDIFVKIPKK